MLLSFNSSKLILCRGKLAGGDTERCWVGMGMATSAGSGEQEAGRWSEHDGHKQLGCQGKEQD